VFRHGVPGTNGIVLSACLAGVPSMARPVPALDPDKRRTQHLHRWWRIADGSAPAAMFTIAQGRDGFRGHEAGDES
jgi:hypothetical protein